MVTRLGAGTAVLLLLATGCAPKPAPVDVDGKVVFSVARPDAPLLIYLHPRDDANKTCSPSAPIDKDGAFHLAKCLPGRYKATLAVVAAQVGANPGAAAPGASAGMGGPAASGLPKNYFNEQSSPWEVTVAPSAKELVTLTVSPQ